MKMRNVLYTAALVITTAALTATVMSQQDKGKGQPPMTPEQQKMMEKWNQFAAPGENHKLLAKKVGKWTIVVKMWEDPDQTPEESTGTTEYKMIMGGRYLTDETTGTAMGQPFLGRGLTSYDNLKKKFVATWIDNMGTGISYAEGTYDAATKSFKYTGEMPCLEIDKYVKGRSVERMADDDHWTMEWYSPLHGTGKEYKMMEISYTRVK